MGGCRRGVLHRDAAELSELDRLALEDHLQTCAACREERAHLRLLRDAGAALPLDPLGDRGHARALAAAFLETARPAEASESVQRRPWFRGWPMLAAAAASAAVVIAIIAVGVVGDRAATRPTATIPPPALAVDAGAVAAPVEDRVDPRVAVFDDVVVRADIGAVWRWNAATRTVDLDEGGVEVEVAPGRAQHLRVVTARFAVEVTGTVFRVTPLDVSVSRGSVRVVATDGAVLVDHLAAGESWAWQVPPPADPAATTDLAETASASVWLRRARDAFNRGEHAAAARHAEAALDAGASRAEAAAARTILAECAQSRGDVADAIARYLAIADRYPDLAAAETALFAAARLEGQHRDRASAVALYRRYLDRFPRGRFAADARRRLATLE